MSKKWDNKNNKAMEKNLWLIALQRKIDLKRYYFLIRNIDHHYLRNFLISILRIWMMWILKIKFQKNKQKEKGALGN